MWPPCSNAAAPGNPWKERERERIRSKSRSEARAIYLETWPETSNRGSVRERERERLGTWDGKESSGDDGGGGEGRLRRRGEGGSMCSREDWD